MVRIHAEPDGSYPIPEGNLFPKGLAKTRPEIFAMGLRNPFSLTVDPKTGWPRVGEVGTDQVGPTYRFNSLLSNSTKLPAWMDGKTLFWDHERETIRLSTLTWDNKVARIDSMMTDVYWRGLVDIQQGGNVSLYTAEYGHGYYTANPIANPIDKISRIDYVGLSCGSVSLAPSRSASAGPGGSPLVYADPSRGLTLDLPAGTQGAEV